MIYFDNAATGGFKASAVLDAAVTTLKYLNANPGRSGHRLALAGAKTVIGARMAVQELFNAEDADRVIFTKNTTEALNLALIGTAEEDGHIVTTVYEHNSVLRTLTHLKERFRIGYTVTDGTPEAIAAAMKKKHLSRRGKSRFQRNGQRGRRRRHRKDRAGKGRPLSARRRAERRAYRYRHAEIRRRPFVRRGA